MHRNVPNQLHNERKGVKATKQSIKLNKENIHSEKK